MKRSFSSSSAMVMRSLTFKSLIVHPPWIVVYPDPCSRRKRPLMTHGFSQERLDRIAPFLERKKIEPGWLPGAQVLQWRRGQTVLDDVAGQRDRVRGTAMERDTIHRIYSMTKPMTSVAALMLLEEGAIALDD